MDPVMLSAYLDGIPRSRLAVENCMKSQGPRASSSKTWARSASLAYLVVDTLHEYIADLDQLLRFIASYRMASPYVK